MRGILSLISDPYFGVFILKVNLRKTKFLFANKKPAKNVKSCPDIIEVNFLVFFVVVKECVFSMCSMLCKLRSTFFLAFFIMFQQNAKQY